MLNLRTMELENMIETTEQVKEHLEALQKEFFETHGTDIPLHILKEALEENIEEQIAKFIDKRSNFISVAMQKEMIRLLDETPLKNQKTSTVGGEGQPTSLEQRVASGKTKPGSKKGS